MLAAEDPPSTEGRAMKSPFPGMDPYIEACGLWEDFHHHFVERIADRLAEHVPERYLVRTGERSYLVLVEEEGKASYPFLPDVSVTAPERPKRPARKKSATAVVEAEGETEPVML